ncbi:MAG: Gfo/Idh/MocA family protein [Frankiaceae bacterium]
MTGPVRWGFLGAGAIARDALAPAVHAADRAVLRAAAARDPARAAGLEPTGSVHADYAALCDDPTIDVVYVALANDAHLTWTLRALAAGKHVLCEKPLGLSAGEVIRMARAADAAGCLLVEASWYRWHPRTRRAEELLASGAIGDGRREVIAEFVFDGVPAGNYRLDPVMGGGALHDVGCYAVSAAHWALGESRRPLAVIDVAAELGASGIDLTTAATLAAPCGRAVVRSSFVEPPHQRVLVSTPTGSVELVDAAFTSLRAGSALRVTLGPAGERIERFGPVDPYRLMVEAVSARVRHEEAYVVPVEESVAIAGTIDAIRARWPAGAAQVVP